MKMTIGMKLGLAFLVVIGLMVLSGGVAYFNVAAMNTSLSGVLDESIPTVRACERLMSRLDRTVAAARGYLIFADDKELAAAFLQERKNAWKEVDAEFNKLNGFAAEWHEARDRQLLEDIRREFTALQETFRKILDVAESADNVPARKTLVTQAAPRAAEMVAALSAGIDRQARQAPSDQQQKTMLALSGVVQTFAASFADLQIFVLTNDAAFKQAYEKWWNLHEEAFQTARSITVEWSAAERADWDRFVQLRGEFISLAAAMIAQRESPRANLAEYYMETESVPARQRLVAMLEQVAAAAESRQAARRGELDAASRRVVAALLAATLVAIALATMIAVALSRKMAGTMRVLTERAKQIAEGDLTGAAIAARSSDELGQLATGFDTMLVRLKELTGQISSVTENVNSAAAQISSSARQQAASTKEQAATVQEVMSTMQEIGRTGEQIVDKAKEVAAAAEEASATSEAGMKAVQTMNRTMEAIREQVEEVAENIVALSEKTQAVGDIIATVNDIAEQSNLLALNAAIEAAEAGAEGNRFSVVAGEMKNLADQAKACTVQVRKILGEIQKGIHASVMLTEEAVKRVESGKQQADVSDEAIRQMSATTEESVQAFQQIIGATNQQQVGLQQVVRGMQDIDQATQQTASGTAQLERAVTSLSSMSHRLRSAVAMYKV